jgi:hypothetical protein
MGPCVFLLGFAVLTVVTRTSEEHAASILNPEDGSRRSLRNRYIYSADYTASHPTRQSS